MNLPSCALSFIFNFNSDISFILERSILYIFCGKETASRKTPSILYLTSTLISAGSICMSDASRAMAPAIIISNTSEIFLDSSVSPMPERRVFRSDIFFTFVWNSSSRFWETATIADLISSNAGSSAYLEKAFSKLFGETRKISTINLLLLRSSIICFAFRISGLTSATDIFLPTDPKTTIFPSLASFSEINFKESRSIVIEARSK